MPIKIHGKDYSTVAERTSAWHSRYPNASITTELEHLPDGSCVAKAIGVPDLDRPERRFTGHACERPDDSQIHKNNHREIAETSAVGRMLAFAGFASDGSIASADEVQRAIAKAAADPVAAGPDDELPPDTDPLYPAYQRLRDMPGALELIEASVKIKACVDVKRYTVDEARALLTFLFSEVCRAASTESQMKRALVTADGMLELLGGAEAFGPTRRRMLDLWQRLQNGTVERMQVTV